jgi:hypothetical protein
MDKEVASKFKFEKWSKQLPAAVVDTLVENGFDSYIALANATTASVTDLGLKPGHHVATLALLRELKGNEGPLSLEHAAATTTPAPTAAAASTTPTLDELLQGQGSSIGVHAAAPLGGGACEPGPECFPKHTLR